MTILLRLERLIVMTYVYQKDGDTVSSVLSARPLYMKLVPVRVNIPGSSAPSRLREHCGRSGVQNSEGMPWLLDGEPRGVQ